MLTEREKHLKQELKKMENALNNACDELAQGMCARELNPCLVNCCGDCQQCWKEYCIGEVE